MEQAESPMDVDATSQSRSPANAACDQSSPSTHNSTINVEDELDDYNSGDGDQLEDEESGDEGEESRDEGEESHDEGEESRDEDEGNGFDGEDDLSERKPRYEVPDHISFIPDLDGVQPGLPCSSYGE
jgi:hypothetical protein